MYTFDEINDATGFACGTKFEDAADVLAYFDRDNQINLFENNIGIPTQRQLNEMAAIVIENHWWME